MNILLANKFYYRRGGDCIYVINLEQLLKSHGHSVAIFATNHPKTLDTPWKRYFPQNMSNYMALTRPFGSCEVKRKFNKLLTEFKPDVVHLNNIHTQLSPIIAKLAHLNNIKVVWTMHDYKLLCPRYDSLMAGINICEQCFDGNKKPCLKHRCIKGSKIASFIGYKEAEVWNRARLESFTDTFICPSNFMAKKMLQGGFSQSKLSILCNFIDTRICDVQNYNKKDYYCFIGRLSHEKGIKSLIQAANMLPMPLKIIGDGPLKTELTTMANSNIEFVGFKQWPEIKQLVASAKFSVIPSEWYENNPLSVIESECLGTPVLGANIGGIPELTDYTFECGNIEDLKNKIKKLWNTSFNYRDIAVKAQAKFSAENYYQNLIQIYTK